MKIKEVDFLALAQKMWQQKKKLIAYVSVGAVLGVVVALATPKRFTADVLLAPELAGGSMGLSGNLAEMASQFGFSVGDKSGGMDAIYPELYPDILMSKDFVVSLFDVPVRTSEGGETRTYIQHLNHDMKFPFWNYPMMWLRKALRKKPQAGAEGGERNKYVMSKETFMRCEEIGSYINCLVDQNTSEIALSFTDQDPLVAAIMADTIQRRLQQYITEYRTSKARTDYAYYCQLHEKAQANFDLAQQRYVDFCDSHQNLNLMSFSAQRDNLEQEMQLAYSVLSQTKAQMVTAEAKIQERTPAYTIISEAKMPYRPSSMPRSLIVLIWMFLAGSLFTLKLYIKDLQ